MVKYFCDMCGVEITDDNHPQGGFNCSKRLGATLEQKGVTLKVEIITGKDGVSNAGAFCLHCILQALNKLDKRPRTEEPVCRCR
jgi:hypothetical protein